MEKFLAYGGLSLGDAVHDERRSKRCGDEALRNAIDSATSNLYGLIAGGSTPLRASPPDTI